MNSRTDLCELEDTSEEDGNKTWTETSVFHLAVKLLAYRDHSCAEVTRKLHHRQVNSELIDSVILSLQDHNYLNDERFAEEYCRQRVAKGYGPLAISAKLKEREVSDHLIKAALQTNEMAWEEVAANCIVGRFSSDQIQSQDTKQVAKISRFVQARGFAGADGYKGLKLARKLTAD